MTTDLECNQCGEVKPHHKGRTDKDASGKPWMQWYNCAECGSENIGPL